MKIAIAQQNYHIGNFDRNREKIIDAIRAAKQEKADLIVFSELCICGYSPHDLLAQHDFVSKCLESIHIIKEETDGIAVIVGAPVENKSGVGKSLFNAAFFLDEKKIKAIVHKTCLPDYDIFDEYRYFEPANSWSTIDYKGKKIALTICEDIWNVADLNLYELTPMDKLIQQKPDFIITISASPFDYNHVDNRMKIIKANVEKYRLPLIYCNTIGSQTDIIFDGGSLALNADGSVLQQLPQFEEAIKYVDFSENEKDEIENKFLANEVHLNRSEKLISSLNIEQVHDALILGMRDYFSKMGFTKAVIGSSGGVDSAITIALACEALGSKNVLSILMPSDFSSSHSVDDAVELSKRLDSPYHIVPIGSVYHSFLKTLNPIFGDRPFNVAEENIQARSRGVILMAVANKLGYILLNTSNKSELAVGYGTLYGDMAGGLSILGDCYKTQIYELAKYINREKEIVPSSILTKAPSAELRPDQFDKDSLPPYEILDQILYRNIEMRQTSSEIIAAGFDEATVNKVLHLISINEFKRSQFCPILRVSSRSLGNGRKFPIVAKF